MFAGIMPADERLNLSVRGFAGIFPPVNAAIDLRSGERFPCPLAGMRHLGGSIHDDERFG
jgi:hypothetical protein